MKVIKRTIKKSSLKAITANEQGTKPKRSKVPKPPVDLLIPPRMEGINRWLIYGLDPSLSRTGYALQEVRIDGDRTKARWLEVGSIKPGDASDPIWIRSKNLALGLLSRLRHNIPCDSEEDCGLIISMEFPTPQNDFLVALNRIIHLVFFDGPGIPTMRSERSILSDNFKHTRVLLTNASTLRSLMGLVMRGAKNKTENIAKAYTFIDQERFPNLDTDSCDAVLLAMMARHTSSILLGFPDEPPDNFRISLTNATKEIKGNGTRARTITKGLLHRPEYWYAYEPAVYSLQRRDARDTKRNLHNSQAII